MDVNCETLKLTRAMVKVAKVSRLLRRMGVPLARAEAALNIAWAVSDNQL